MAKTQEQLFLQVKERLDYYRLPTIFPLDATPLLQKVLSLLDQYASSSNKENAYFAGNQDNPLDNALRHEIGKVVKENNQLHVQLMTAKEQIQSLNYRLSKYTIERSDGQAEMAQTLYLKEQREKELFEDLQQVKFKYNQLMDLIHEDPTVEKRYLKRLLKHKKMDIDDYEKKQTSSKKGRKSEGIRSELENENQLLISKVSNREAEILRLQKRIEYDGINMNKVIKDFQSDKVAERMQGLNERINYLEEENSKMKKEVGYCRKTGGSAEALREEMRKNHETIKNLTAENKELKRKMKEVQFDTKATMKEEQRNKQKIRKQMDNQREESQMVQISNADLQKKAEFYAKEMNHLKKQLEEQREKNMKKEIALDEMKNSQEGGKILNQYEIQSLKQKLTEANELIDIVENRNRKLGGEVHFYKEEGILKNQAIENLEKIVDELMKKNQLQREIKANEEGVATDIENVIMMRKNMAQLKQLLSVSQNENLKLEKELVNLKIHYENCLKDKKLCEQEFQKIKSKMCDMKNFENSLITLETEREKLRADLKKEENLRFRIDSLFKESESEKDLLRKQLHELNQEFQLFEKKAKSHSHELMMNLATLEETNAILELRLKEKEKRIEFYEHKVDEIQSKLKNVTDQILAVEEEKHELIRDKYRLEKRYEELQKSNEEVRKKELQLLSLSENEKATEIIWLKKELHKHEENIKLHNERMLELERACEILRGEKDGLFGEKLQFLRENDHLRLRINELEGIVSDRR